MPCHPERSVAKSKDLRLVFLAKGWNTNKIRVYTISENFLGADRLFPLHRIMKNLRRYPGNFAQ